MKLRMKHVTRENMLWNRSIPLFPADMLLRISALVLILHVSRCFASVGERSLLLIQGGTVVNHDQQREADVLIDTDSGLVLEVDQEIQVQSLCGG